MVLLTARAAQVANKKHIRSLELVFLTITYDYDEPPLLWALKDEKYDLAKYLVEERGADVTVSDDEAIIIVASAGLLDLVILFHKNGADIHTGESVVRQAAMHGHMEVVKYFMSHGADVRI